jgi:hypothetical protein
LAGLLAGAASRAPTSRIYGSILDPSGAAVVVATIRAINQASGIESGSKVGELPQNGLLAVGAIRGTPGADMPRIVATGRIAPPVWAIMERHLIATMNQAAPEFLHKYAEPGGRMPLIGKPDDMYEVFANWPLFYALGGDDQFLDWSLQQWSAITRELEALHRVQREFVIGYDWFHHSEGYKFFYHLGLLGPIGENADRARSFAAMYMGEDPAAQNYDPEHKIMRSPITGSTGPVFQQDAVYLLTHGHASLWPLSHEDFEPGWEKDPAKHAEIQQLYDRVVIRGDTPISLSSTSLVANAYLYSGDEKYRRWIVDYVGAWMDRIHRNGGIIPDNVGPSGIIGEMREGQWWGGLFGWNARYSLHMILGALTASSEVANMVTGDPRYLDLLRSQLDMLRSHAKTLDGELLFPYRYGPQGWFDYRPLEVREPSHLWNASMRDEDWQRIQQILAGYRYGPRPYDNYNDYAMPVTGHKTYHWQSNGREMHWTAVVSNGDIGDVMQEQEELNEAPRLLYLAGKNADFPEKILTANYREVLRRIDLSRHIKDIFRVPDLISEYLVALNPVVTHGLVYLTMGGPEALYNCGLLQVRLRYFDADRLRPGLPEDVAALVEKIEPARVVVQLVNLSPLATRRLIVQAGAFGEHQFTTVGDGARQYVVNGKYFGVEFPPATGVRIDAGMRRFVNRPSYALPWTE